MLQLNSVVIRINVPQNAVHFVIYSHHNTNDTSRGGSNCEGYTNELCVGKKNQLDASEWFITLIICSTSFGHFYADHQELETICALLPAMVCDALFAGCWRSGAGQPAMRSG